MEEKQIAYFVSSHGFGHASRSAAIMAAVRRQDPQIQIDVFTETPEWFFKESEVGIRHYFRTQSDIGIIQKSPMEMDIPATERAVGDFLFGLPAKAEQIGVFLREHAYRLVLCDISPLGILAAVSAGIPSILFENFTWDWIYQPFADQFPGFFGIIHEMAGIYALADSHCQLIPFCGGIKSHARILQPVSRDPQKDRSEIRRLLGIAPEDKMGLISMGGIPDRFENISGADFERQGIKLVIPGSFADAYKNEALILLPHHSGFYHPDLVAAADFVIGKAGYSTIAEVVAQGTPFGYLLRDDFRESEDFRDFLRQQDFALEVDRERFERFDLSADIDQLLSLRPKTDAKLKRNGAAEAADFILQKLPAA